jgi:hypothetical protein
MGSYAVDKFVKGVLAIVLRHHLTVLDDINRGGYNVTIDGVRALRLHGKSLAVYWEGAWH